MIVRWPDDAPVCKHVYWGTVTLTDVEVEWIHTLGRHVAIVRIHPDELWARSFVIAAYANQSWFEHLTPLTPVAREMLAEAKLNGALYAYPPDHAGG